MNSKSRSCRRRSSVRPSVSSVGGESLVSNHFFKVILPSAIHGKKLKIPDEFIRRFGNELSTVATIIVSDSQIWKMELKKSGKEVWLGNGWQEFRKYYSISDGSFLVLKYKGNSDFHVLIFDMTGAEIYYPCKSQSKNAEPNVENWECVKKRSRPNQHRDYEARSKRLKQENEVEIIDVDGLDAPSPGKSKKEVRFNPRLHLEENENSRSEQDHARRKCDSSSELESLMLKGKQRAIKAAEKFKPKNPSFTAILSQSIILRKYLYVPSSFAQKYLKINHSIKLQDSNGQQWEVNCTDHNCRSQALRLGKGWHHFAKDKHLREGDVCVFELFKRKKQIVLQVTVFYATEFGYPQKH